MLKIGDFSKKEREKNVYYKYILSTFLKKESRGISPAASPYWFFVKISKACQVFGYIKSLYLQVILRLPANLYRHLHH